MPTRQRQTDELDQTVTFPAVASGVMERRVKEEIAAYESRVENLRRTYDNSVHMLNSVHMARIRAIAADPFVKLDGQQGNGEQKSEVQQ